MNVYGLVLFAQNTQSFYQKHLTMAKEKQTWLQWFNHVKVWVLPTYRKEMGEPFDGMSIVDLGLVADALKAYYEEHIKEM